MEQNLYEYALSNPVILTDPSGLTSCHNQAERESCCGPDATEWFRKVVNANIDYHGETLLGLSLEPVRQVRALERIIRRLMPLPFDPIATPLLYRYMVYGLAVRFVQIDYHAMVTQVANAPKPDFPVRLGKPATHNSLWTVHPL